MYRFNFFVTFFILSSWIFSFAANAFELEEIMSSPRTQKTLFKYTGETTPNSSFSQTRTQSHLRYQELSFSHPLSLSPQQRISIKSKYSALNIIPDQRLPPDLTSISLGMNFTHFSSQGSMWALMTNFGSSSDHPLQNSLVNTINTTALYSHSMSGQQTHRWLYFLNYSNNRPILNNIPLPGFAYMYMPSTQLQATLGIPFAAIFWQFHPEWNMLFFTVVPWTIKWQLNYLHWSPTVLSLGTEFSQSTYLLAQRSDHKQRLYHDQKKIYFLGKIPFNSSVVPEMELGYKWMERFFSARTYKIHPDNGSTVAPHFYFKLSLLAQF